MERELLDGFMPRRSTASIQPSTHSISIITRTSSRAFPELDPKGKSAQKCLIHHLSMTFIGGPH
jgi:hypothetical protein